MNLIRTYPTYFTAICNTHALWQAVDKWQKRTGGDFSDKLDTVTDRLFRFKWVEDVCFDHMCWVKFDFETERMDVFHRRLQESLAKIERMRRELEGKD